MEWNFVLVNQPTDTDLLNPFDTRPSEDEALAVVIATRVRSDRYELVSRSGPSEPWRDRKGRGVREIADALYQRVAGPL